MNLTSENVRKIISDCFFTKDEVRSFNGAMPDDAVIVEGIRTKVGFKRERLESHRQKVKELLEQLPDGFHKGKGGGWSFLNACMDRDGNQWGEHVNMDELFMLAQGLGMAEYLLPRKAWDILPGGMPYLVVDVNGTVRRG